MLDQSLFDLIFVDAELNPFDHDARTAKILFKMNTDDMRPKEPNRAQSMSFSLPPPTREKSDAIATNSNDVIAPESTGLTENAELPTKKVSDKNIEVLYTLTKDQDKPKPINPEKLKNLKTATRKAKELGPKEKGDIGDVSVWDFGGHFVFYSTHQVFMSRRAIYLAVTDITKDAEEIMNHDKYLMDMSGKTDMKYGGKSHYINPLAAKRTYVYSTDSLSYGHICPFNAIDNFG